MGKIIVICNQKGGVGKTTTAVNLGGYLARAGKKVLLCDLDPQANATSGLGEDKGNSEKNIYGALIGEIKLGDAVKHTEIPGLDLISSCPELAGAEVELVGQSERERALAKVLTGVCEDYDYVFVDTPPSLGLLTINGLTAADTVLITLQCEYYALEGLSHLLKTINLVKENLNPRLEIEGVLMTMADYRTRLTSEVIAEAKSFFGEKVYQTIITRSIRLTEAPGFGKPIVLYDATSSGAKCYEQLSGEFLKRQQILPVYGENSPPTEILPSEKTTLVLPELPAIDFPPETKT